MSTSAWCAKTSCGVRAIPGTPSIGLRRHRTRDRYSAPIGALSPLDGTFFALSDPTRRGILDRLGGGPATISELAQPYGLTLNGVKKHVGILERADLVVTKKVGRARECRLGSGSLGEATEWIEGYRRFWEASFERLDALLQELKAEHRKGRRRPATRRKSR